jgi:hypothetical protein
MVSKLVHLLFIAALVSLAAGPVEAAQSNGLTLQVTAHYGGHFKYGEWLPLRVTLANDGPAVQATVRADTTAAGGQTTFSAPVELPTGARKQITLYVLPPSFAQAVRVRVLAGERELASQAAPVQVEKNINYLVGVLAPRTNAFVLLGGLKLNTAMAAWNVSTPRPVVMLPIALDDIPARAEGLRLFDALIISGVDTSGLQPAQSQALLDWVSQGGRLILGGGASAARTLAGMPAGLVQDVLAPGVTADVPALEALGQFGEQPVRVPGPFAVTWPPAGPDTLLAQEGQALVVERRVGNGHINYVALDVAGSPFDAWAGAARFWERLLTPGAAYSSGLPQDVSPNMMRAQSLSYALQNMPALALPAIRWLAILLVVYILLIGPVNYVLLRQLRRLEWGWLTIPLFTLAFSIGAFALGTGLRGGDVIINQISIMTFAQNGQAASMQTLVGIFSPERTAYTLDLPEGALAAPVTLEDSPWGWNGGGALPGALDVVQGNPAQVRGVQVNQWALQSFYTESPPPREWQLAADLVFDGERLRGTLHNGTGQTLVDVSVVNGNRFAHLGDVPPGVQPLDVALQSPNGSSFPYFLYENMWQNAGPGGPPRELQVRQQVLDAYFGNFKGGAQAPAYVTLIGWLPTSPLLVSVSNARWTRQETSMIVAELATRYPAGGVFLPAGSIPAQLIELQGDAGMCGPAPSSLYLNNGTVILEYQLPDGLAALQVSRMMLQVVVGATLPEVAVYSADTGDWVVVDAPPQAQIELPDPARLLLSGNTVRVRLRTTNLMPMGVCSSYDLVVEGVLP